ncbi:hypothetical protein ENBRE01_0392, partial [Enteropsectra breve]
MDNQGTNKIKLFDMATRTNNVPQFTGAPEDDVTAWVANIKFIIKLHQLEENDALRLICMSLKDDAFDWARETLTRSPSTTVELFLQNLESRFLSKLHISNVAQRFLSDSIPTTIPEYFSMLKDASYLSDRGYMSFDALTDRIITRSPSEIRIALWQAAGHMGSIFDLIKVAEKIIPLTFGKPAIPTASDINTSQEFNRVQFFKPKNITKHSAITKKWCKIHGECFHSTKECRKLRSLNSNRHQVDYSTSNNAVLYDSDENDINKSQSSYYFSSTQILKSDFPVLNSPFKRTTVINGKQYKILIDTGADTSLIPKDLVTKEHRIVAVKHSPLAANNLPIKLHGKINNFPITLNNQ